MLAIVIISSTTLTLLSTNEFPSICLRFSFSLDILPALYFPLNILNTLPYKSSNRSLFSSVIIILFCFVVTVLIGSVLDTLGLYPLLSAILNESDSSIDFTSGLSAIFTV